MSCIHFKFKNRQESEKVPISGLEISGKELKEAIMKKKKIGHSNLQIADAQSKKVYSDTDMIKRNASVVVMRSMIPNAAKLPKTQHRDPSLLPTADLDAQNVSVNQSNLQKGSDLTSLSGSEEDKLLIMMRQAGEGFTAEDYAKYPVRAGIPPGLFKRLPPQGYVCNRCRKPGHWIQLCPTNGDPNFDRRNKQEVPRPSSTVGMKAKHVVRAPAEKVTPEELKCPICKKLLRDAVVIPCCNKNFCDECIREHLLETEFTCPLCNEEDVSPDSLAPNRKLRESVKQFKSQAAEEKSIAVAMSSGATLTPHQASASLISPKALVTGSTIPSQQSLSQLTSQFKGTRAPSLPTTSTITTSTPPTITNSPQKSAAPAAVKPVAVKPVAMKPVAMKPVAMKPVAMKPVAVEQEQVKEVVKEEGPVGTGSTSQAAAAAVSSAVEEEEKSETVETVQPAAGDDEKKAVATQPAVTTTQPAPSAKLGIPDIFVKEGSRSPSPQRSQNSSPGPLPPREVKKPAPQLPPVLLHPLTSSTHNMKLHPPPFPPALPPSLASLIRPPGMPPPILPQPILLGQPTAIPGKANILNSLPGLGMVPTVRVPMPPQPVMKDFHAEAEFLLNQGKESRPASPPLTADEFYRQQKLMQFVMHKSPAHSMGSASDRSYSSGSESDDMSDSRSSSSSVSESDLSTYSHSRSRSRSRSVSPRKGRSGRYKSRGKQERLHRHDKKRDRERAKERGREREREREEREREREEKERERVRGRERERGRERSRPKRKHRRHELAADEVDKKHRKSNRERKKSPRPSYDDGLDRHHRHHSSDTISSAVSETGQRRHHKKRSKRRHRHHRSAQIRGEDVGEGQGRGERVRGHHKDLEIDEDMESRALAAREELGLKVLVDGDSQGAGNKVGVVRDTEDGAVPAIRAPRTAQSAAEMNSKIERVSAASAQAEDAVLGGMLKQPVSTQRDGETSDARQESASCEVKEKSEVVAREVGAASLENAGTQGSEDELLEDIDKILAEEQHAPDASRKEQPPSTVEPAVGDSAAVCSGDAESMSHEVMQGDQVKSAGNGDTESMLVDPGEAEDEERGEGGQGEGGEAKDEEGVEGEGGERKEDGEEEADHLDLHTEETIDDDTSAGELDGVASEASDELEEGELLSDMNSDREDNTGQLPVAPGRYQATPIQAVPIQATPIQAVPIQAASVPEKPVVKKPRLKSIASTVQVVNSSDTPNMAGSSVDSTSSPFSPPLREERRNKVGKKRRPQRELEVEREREHKAKKRKLKDREKAERPRHKQKKRVKEREREQEEEKERVREREQDREGGKERVRRKDGEREKARKRKEKERKRREKHGHQHKKRRPPHSPS